MLKKVGIGAAVAFTLALGGLYIYAFTLPSSWTIEASRRIEAPPEAVYEQLAELEAWPQWSYWSEKSDPTAEFTVTSKGEGSEMSWNGDKLGQSRLVLRRALPSERVEYDFWFAGRDQPSRGVIRVEPQDGGAEVVWTDRGDVEGNPLLRLLVGSIEDQMTDKIERSLIGLERQAEK